MKRIVMFWSETGVDPVAWVVTSSPELHGELTPIGEDDVEKLTELS